MAIPLKDIERWQHEHVFSKSSHGAERGARMVTWITLAMMTVEIVAGYWFNSMALLADGWHMSSHAMAIGMSALAYAAARKYAHDSRFASGTWKIEILAGYTSALLLLGIAALMVIGSAQRLLAPQPIHYREAITIAGIGLVVNLVCALILGGAHDHGPAEHGRDDGDGHLHAHGHSADRSHHHHDHHQDLNLKAAYVHVLADAATSVLALVALTGGWIFGWSWLDPVMGMVGAAVVAVRAKGLMAQTGKALLDREMDHAVVAEIRDAVEAGGDARVADLHVLRVGKRDYSCALSVVTDDHNLTPSALRQRITVHEEVVHTTIEVHFA